MALEAGNSPAMIFQHYRELVRPADAKRWFGLMPGISRNIIDMRPSAATTPDFEATQPATRATRRAGE